jgi:ASC-1-like (ASCH) protein
MYILYIKNIDTFNQIKSGIKNIEVRKQSNFIDSLKSDTFIMFVHNQNYCIKYIISIKLYNSLEKLLELNILSEINSTFISLSNCLIYYQQYYKNITGNFYAIYIR